MNLPKEIHERAQYWSQSEIFDAKTREEIRTLIDNENVKDLADRFYRDLEFGTGGMRGLMGAGSARFNVYNVRRATHALALYLKSIYGKSELKLAISYDSRNKSRFYAEATAGVLAAHGIRSLLTKEMRPVPMLSFMVRHFHCHAGVCITASHNPAPYNGYKIYWKSGGQLIEPHDAKIWSFYEQANDYTKIPFIDFTEAFQNGLVSEVSDELDNTYFEKVKSLSLFSGGRDLKIVYSPLHGTGYFALPSIFNRFGFKQVSLVAEQSQPDGNFPTVRSPNPEDPEALVMAMELGRSINADIVLATDPDADRLAVVVHEEGMWVHFSGNQMGALLFEYVLSILKSKNQLPKNALTIKTIVTSDLLCDISKHYGIACEETLTGFKWICDLVDRYESGELKPNKTFLCGAEESYGFLAGNFVRDKDAILSGIMAVEMVAYYRSLKKSLSQVLDELYVRHGFYCERLETLTLPGKDGDEKIKSMMRQLRASPLLKIGVNDVTSTKDYLEQKHLPKSDVLQFQTSDAILTVRPSGTEPKLKIYLSLKTSTQSLSPTDLPQLKIQANAKADSLLKEFLRILAES